MTAPSTASPVASLDDAPGIAVGAIELAARYLEAEAKAARSGAGLDVSPDEISFAAQRLRACADGLRAGLHLPTLPIEESTDA